jgi:predicted Zn-dependent protease
LCLTLLGATLVYQQRTTRAAYLLQQGRRALDQGDWELAKLQAADLEARGHVETARLLRAEGWLRASRGSDAASAPIALQRALAEVGRMRDDGPLGTEGVIIGAQCLTQLGENRLAAQALETLVRRHPATLEAHRRLAALYMDLNSPYQAIEHFRAWGALEPQAGIPYRWVGFFLKDDHKVAEAVEAYREALRRGLDPAMRDAVVQELAQTQLDGLKDPHAALQTLAEVPPRFPDQPDVLLLQAQCHWALGESAEAGRLANRVLLRAPDLTAARLLWAQVLLNEDRPREARAVLEEAVRRDAHDLAAARYLVQVYHRLGEVDREAAEQKHLSQEQAQTERISQLHTQAARDPWNAGLRCEIAALCLQRNRLAEARTWVQAVLTCDPHSGLARELSARLAALEGNAR